MNEARLNSFVTSSLSVLDVATDWNTNGNSKNDSTSDGNKNNVNSLELGSTAVKSSVSVSAIADSCVGVANALVVLIEGTVGRAVAGASFSCPDKEIGFIGSSWVLNSDHPVCGFIGDHIEEVRLFIIVRAEGSIGSQWESGERSIEIGGITRTGVGNTNNKVGSIPYEISDGGTIGKALSESGSVGWETTSAYGDCLHACTSHVAIRIAHPGVGSSWALSDGSRSGECDCLVCGWYEEDVPQALLWSIDGHSVGLIDLLDGEGVVGCNWNPGVVDVKNWEGVASNVGGQQVVGAVISEEEGSGVDTSFERNFNEGCECVWDVV